MDKLFSLEKRSVMHAAVFYASNNIVYEEVYDNPLKEKRGRFGGSVLKVNACSVCPYDVRVLRNGHSKVVPPIILGHEICCETVEDITTRIGPSPDSSTEIKSGTRVVISPIIPCLKCVYCANNQYNLCNDLKEIGSSVNGGFAEYVNIPKQILEIGGVIPIPGYLSNEEAALIEPLACCLNGFSHIGHPLEAQSVVVLGDGPIGLLHLQLSKNLYHAKTAVVGKVPQRLQKAISLGADTTIMIDDNEQECESSYINRSHDVNSKSTTDVLQFTGGKGADIVIIATSDPAAFDFALKVVSKNSKINIFSGIAKDSKVLSIDPNWLHYNQVSITGSFSSSPKTLHEALRLVCDGQINLSKLIGRSYSLVDIEQAIIATEKCVELRAIINKF